MKEKDKRENIENLKWKNKILIGIICLLIGIIITIISVRLSDNVEMVNTISIGTGLVSMALAFVAIAYSMKQDVSSTIINNNTLNLLNQINNNIDKIDNKVSNINMKPIEDSRDTLEQFKLDIDKLNNDIFSKSQEVVGSNKIINADETFEKIKETIRKIQLETEERKKVLDKTIYDYTHDLLDNLSNTEREVFLMMNGWNEENRKYDIREISRILGYSIASTSRMYIRVIDFLKENNINTDKLNLVYL